LRQDETAAARKRTRDLLSNDEGNDGDAKDGGTELSSKDVTEDTSPLVFPDDDKFTTFSFLLMSNMRRCVFTEADRLGKRKGLTNGFAGLACRHCFGGFGSGRFFPSSIKTLSDTSKTLDVIFNHFERCREVPKSVITELAEAKKTHEAERANLKFGSQKAFFSRIWKRLHHDRPDGLKIDPPLRVKKTNNNSSVTDAHEKSASNDTSIIDGSSSDELKRFRDNITRITGNMNMNGGNIMTSMMTGGFMNPAILDAMCGGSGGGGGNQSMMAMPRFAEGNDEGEGDQQRHAEV